MLKTMTQARTHRGDIGSVFSALASDPCAQRMRMGLKVEAHQFAPRRCRCPTPCPRSVSLAVNLEELSLAIREKDIHAPNTSLLCLENTHNRCGGTAIPESVISDTCEIAHKKGLGVHLDGARIFNAEVFLNESAALIAQNCDSVSFCFSKGLVGPVGSMLCGSRLLIEKARRYRKMLGGGMRQVGILAAAGIYALEHNIARLDPPGIPLACCQSVHQFELHKATWSSRRWTLGRCPGWAKYCPAWDLLRIENGPSRTLRMIPFSFGNGK